MSSIALTLAASCGGGRGGGRDSSDEFLKAANAICKEEFARVDDIPEPKSPDEALAVLQKALPIARELLDRLRELHPPPGLRARWQVYLSLLREADANVDRTITEWRTGDRTAAQQTLERLDQVDRRAGDLAFALGLHDCATD